MRDEAGIQRQKEREAERELTQSELCEFEKECERKIEIDSWMESETKREHKRGGKMVKNRLAYCIMYSAPLLS